MFCPYCDSDDLEFWSWPKEWECYECGAFGYYYDKRVLVVEDD